MSQKISEMAEAAALVGDEVLPVVQEGANVKATVAQVKGETYFGNWGIESEESFTSGSSEFNRFEENLESLNTGAAEYVAGDEFDPSHLEILVPGVYRVTMQTTFYNNIAPFTRPGSVVYEMGLKGDLTLFVVQGVMHYPTGFATDLGNFISLSGTGILIVDEGMWLNPFIRAHVPGATQFNWTFDGGLIIGLERLGPYPDIGG